MKFCNGKNAKIEAVVGLFRQLVSCVTCDERYII